MGLFKMIARAFVLRGEFVDSGLSVGGRFGGGSMAEDVTTGSLALVYDAGTSLVLGFWRSFVARDDSGKIIPG
jgi:hypothetical protein